MKTDILTTEVIDKIAVVTLGSPKKMYFDMAMGDTLRRSYRLSPAILTFVSSS